MDDELIERRGEGRLPAEVLCMPQATLRPGCPVDVIDLSSQGLQHRACARSAPTAGCSLVWSWVTRR
jgi:hypothetical protein